MMYKNWIVKVPHPQLQKEISQALGIHPLIAQVLINRHVTTIQEAQDFLCSDLSRLHDPFLLTDMAAAVDRIKKSARDKERVLIFGDYDVDGITSSVLLRRALNRLGIDVEHYIPHRLKEGYGLNHNVIGEAVSKGVSLLICVDCGISAFDQVDALNRAGIEVIILDHHEPSGGRLPAALAIINPKRKDCRYPFKGLASAGLALKLSQALLGEISQEVLELAALGTIADVAELTGENRILAKEGVDKINHTKNIGLKALMEAARIKNKKMSARFISFILGPRINATGRLTSAAESLNLLLSERFEEAYLLAKNLEEVNAQRQKTQNAIIEEALAIVEQEVNFKEYRVIVIGSEGWHRGVLGIVASRLLETYYRPTIVISFENGIGVGSARSEEGFHLFEALVQCSEFLENFGGHKHAAGLTVRKENLNGFREAINTYAKKVMAAQHLVPHLELDAEVRLSILNRDLAETIERIEPFGEGNPVPHFCSRRVLVKGAPVVLGRDTLKFWVSDGQLTVSAVGFGMGKFQNVIAESREIDLAYSLGLDDWNQEPTVQLRLKDIKVP